MFTLLEELLCAGHLRITGRAPESGTQAPLFCTLLALSCIVYAQALLFPVLGIDTYTYFLSDGAGDVHFEIIRGTWGFVLLNKLLPGPLVSPLISMLFFLLLNTWSTTLIVQFWIEHRPDWKTYATGVLIALFPYWASQAYFSYYHYGYTLATFFGVLTVLLPWHCGGLWRIGAAAVCFVAGTSIYQGSVTIATGLVGASLLVGLTRTLKDRTAPPFFTFRALVRVCSAMLLGSAGYIGLHKLVLNITHLPIRPDGGYAVHFNLDMQQALRSLHHIVPGSDFLLPWQTAAVLGLIILALLAGIGIRLWRKQTWLWGLLPVALLVAILSPLPLAIIQPLGLAPRSLGSTAFVWSAVFLSTALLWGGKGRKPLVAASCILALLFASRINYAWFVQRLTTESDITNATLMYQRIASLPEFADAPKPVNVSLVGCRPESSLPWEQDLDSIFGISQFACFNNWNLPQHAWAVLRFTGTRMKTIPSTFKDLSVTQGRQPWPADESVFADGNHFVIWLGSPQSWQATPEKNMAHFATVFDIHDPSITMPIRPAQETWPFTLAQAGKELWGTVQPGLTIISGHVDQRSPIEGETRFSRVRGWGFDQSTKILPPYVVLMDCNDRIAGVAATGVPRADLVQHVAVDAYYAGFEGYVLNDVEICTIAYARP